MSSSKFVIMKNEAAILELALINWSVDFLRKKGYTFIISPDLCKSSIIEGCGFLPRDRNACICY
jgi:seryl-tRNA synthetase